VGAEATRGRLIDWYTYFTSIIALLLSIIIVVEMLAWPGWEVVLCLCYLQALSKILLLDILMLLLTENRSLPYKNPLLDQIPKLHDSKQRTRRQVAWNPVTFGIGLEECG
jgi:hypothetical protein